MDNNATQSVDLPLFMDYAVKVPADVRIEQNADGQDCVTWGESGCDDD